ELVNYFSKISDREKDVLFVDFNDQLREFIISDESKAKRIHPVLLIAAFGGIINPMYLDDQIESIRKVSIAVEFLHSGHLIHDDLIDNDNTRRGKPTFHVQLTQEIEKLYNSMNLSKKDNMTSLYGRDMSILGGAYGYLLGLEVIKSSKFADNLKLLAINEYSKAIDFLLKGLIIEEYMYYHNITMTLEQYLNIAEMQRARMFEKSTSIGAILARGNLHYQIKPLSEAMLKIGQAHAIRDDILDMEQDIQDQKKKFLYILAVQNTDEEQSKLLNEIYRKESVNREDLEKVKKIFAETNATIVAEQFSKNLVEQAKNHLADVYPDLNKKQKAFFYEFSDFIYMRNF
ncbi:MAG: hypothetical protein GF353_07790, partial [Candidatus Lokiarchaeota archaeon]|nr:hypothetical protein [Candidatus Lokiarchaeota archaeon]